MKDGEATSTIIEIIHQTTYLDTKCDIKISY